jgi:hypothetical protein
LTPEFFLLGGLIGITWNLARRDFGAADGDGVYADILLGVLEGKCRRQGVYPPLAAE